MLGKLICWGRDRDEAVARSRDAIDELVVEGIVTNTPLHRALLDNETFLNGEFTTNLLDRVGSAAFLGAEAAA
jgi:acetyl-CoA carboxylase biotin carboxylase subunit